MKKMGGKSTRKKRAFDYLQSPFQLHTSETHSSNKTLQELRMLSRSLSDYKSLLLNVMIQVLQFVSYSQPCH